MENIYEALKKEINNLKNSTSTLNSDKVTISIKNIENSIDFLFEKAMKEKLNSEKIVKNFFEKKEVFEIIFDNIDIGLFIINVVNNEFYVESINRAYEKATGFKKDDVKNKNIKEIVDTKLYSAFTSNYQECINKKEPLEYEEILFVNSKRTYWFTKLIPLIENEKVIKIIGTSVPITEYKASEKEAKKRESFLKTLLDTIPNPIFYKDENLRYLGCNKAFEDILRLRLEDIIGKNVFELSSRELAEEYHKKDIELLKNPYKQQYEAQIKNANDQYRDVLFYKAVYEIDGEIAGIIGTILDITEIKNYQRILKELSLQDELTQIYNKRGIKELSQSMYRELIRNKGTLGILMIDIDNFKKYNDTYGHPEGDVCLSKIAQTIKESCNRPRDLVGRYGGEEFIVFLPNTDIKGTIVVAERILKKIRNLKIPHKTSPTADVVTVSIGVLNVLCDKNIDLDTHIFMVDNLLYKAKKNGRNRYEV
ncbi:PAS domain S-box-containing protein/diguanylate cyclase (GGDEF)-like protein [Hypnocyclicus thermotrophus]|uniref:PAS domain S-box-containing protein/diguanylate cyclase (GGDEF)-like protein n=1 Tax=Hypnocyclicus thermotrophus TaxID=1627895 RepID=A0AA46DY98_9FUSO|nr:diguanylate cyclase [Hypnocyclicus thermotrophus]TDT69709.1 PAS domain S-box-containing protein/diguanylate cyclase (GGDEF)-like protein [Hypnocyclicus thermotrophus]